MFTPFGWPHEIVAAALLLALFLDALIGDPRWLYSRIPHPVALFGRLIGALDRRFNQPSMGTTANRVRGTMAALITIGFAGGAAIACTLLARWMLGDSGWIAEAAIASMFLAGRDLHDRARDVAHGLNRSLDDGRDAVAHLVGRDPASLDRAGVARATIESVAENLSDGVVAPAFWYLILGLPGLVAYKTINTLDSMLGYKNERYDSFGFFSANIDDITNYIPARLTASIIVISGMFYSSNTINRRFISLRFFAVAHISPNAGWPETAMADALDLSLGGPTRYPTHSVERAWLGDGRRNATANDILRALSLYRTTLLALAGLVAILTFT